MSEVPSYVSGVFGKRPDEPYVYPAPDEPPGGVVEGKRPDNGVTSASEALLASAGGLSYKYARRGTRLHPPREQPQRIFSFVRHGEAEHNPLIAAGKLSEGRALLDPGLTTLGHEQANKLAEELSSPHKQFDMIITSPLLRALQTTEHLVKVMDKCDVVVVSLHTENGIPIDGDPAAGTQCQRGSRGVAELQKAFPSEWDFRNLASPREWTDAGGWLAPRSVADRLQPFRDFLNALPTDKDILVVGHSGFYKKFLGQDQKMANCEVVTRGIDGPPEKRSAKQLEADMDPMQFLTSFV